MKLAAKRNFEVDYYEKDENIWVVESYLNDEPHEIKIIVEVNMEEMRIVDAKAEFSRYPLQHCIDFAESMKELIGMTIDNNFMPNAIKKLGGPYGCFNVNALLTISVPGIIYYYYPYKIKTGRMSHEQWENMMVTDLKNQCIGHTLLGEK